MFEKFKDRLDFAMEKKGIKTYSEVARLAKINPNSITRWVAKDGPPRGSSYLALSSILDVSFEWFSTGKGPTEPEYVLAPVAVPQIPESHLVSLPFISSAWGHLIAIRETRGLKLSDEEESRIIVRASWVGMQEGREPTMKDVLDAISTVLGGE